MQKPKLDNQLVALFHPIDPITRINPWKPESELRDWNYIVLHHTASDSGSLDSIHQEHLKRKDKEGNSWLGIGYHFVIGNGNGMADGEIEPTFRWRQQLQGAHAGVGLGHEFLKHVERTKMFIHLVEPAPDDQSDPIENYVNIREELRLYDEELSKRPEIVCVTKCELADANAVAELLEERTGRPVLKISSVAGKGLPQLLQQTIRLLDDLQNPM